MEKREKKPVHKVVMTEGKDCVNILSQIQFSRSVAGSQPAILLSILQ